MVDWIQDALPSVDFSPLMALSTNGRHNDTDFRLNIFDAHDVKTALTIAVSNAINCYAYQNEDPDYNECVPVVDISRSGDPHRRQQQHQRSSRRGRAISSAHPGHHHQQHPGQATSSSRHGRMFDFKGMLGKVFSTRSTPSNDDSDEQYYDNEYDESEEEEEAEPSADVQNNEVPSSKKSNGKKGSSPAEGKKQQSYKKGAGNKQTERGKGNTNRNEIRQDPAEDRLDSRPQHQTEDPADDRWGHGGGVGGGYAMPMSTFDMGGYWGLRQPKGGCYCAIGSSKGGKKKFKKPKDLSSLYLLGLPLATFGTLTLGIIGLGAGYLLGQILRQLIFNNNNNGRIGDFLLRGKRDLANELEFIDENEIVLRMLDDLMMTYKYGYIPKCSHYHICKLNKAAAFGGAPQSTVIPLVSLPAAWILGKPTSRVMDYLHAVWLGRNERDCDEAFPECSDMHVSQSDAFSKDAKSSTGSPTASSTILSFFNSTTAKPKVKMEDVESEAETNVDKILEDLRFLEQNATAAAASSSAMARPSHTAATSTGGADTQSA